MSFNKFILIVFIFFTKLFSQESIGVFSRIGIDARSIAFGNNGVALTNNPNSSYHNPAVLVYSENMQLNTTYSFLTLDRNLQTLNYILKIKPKGALSVGIISSGVSNIDLRDGDGSSIGNASIFENQYYLSFANNFSDKFSAGITIKMNHAKLYENLTSLIPGFDFGILYKVFDNLTFGASIKELSSKYKWDTSKLYGQEYGNSTVDYYPLVKRFGTTYFYEPFNLFLSGEFYSVNNKNFMRAGSEVKLYDNFTLYAGIDKYSSEANNPVSPSFGFTVYYPFQEYKVNLTYAYVLESYKLSNAHWITISTSWK